MDLNHAAKVLKEKGNNYYLRDEFEQAIRAYDQALEYVSDDPILHSNKSVCFLKMKKFENALKEADVAIKLDPKATKAWYYRGQALMDIRSNNGNTTTTTTIDRLHDAEKAFEKALVLGQERSNEKKVGSAFTKQIHNSLQQVRRMIWEREQKQELESMRELFQYTRDVMKRCESTVPDRDVHMLRKMQLESFFDQFEQLKKPKEIPDYFCCKITFDVMLDPVITPSGITYERSAIEEHLHKNSYDPVTRGPCTIKDLRPNLAIKEAIEEWLRLNPYYT